MALYYDLNKKDVYATTSQESLGYSELLGQFVSFYDYQGGILFNIGDDFFALTNDGTRSKVDLWWMFGGKYGNHFYEWHDSDFTYVSNADTLLDKTFTNVDIEGDFYADVKEDDYYNEKGTLRHDDFFDSITVWDEYQTTGETPLTYKSYPYKDGVASNLKKKFRVWHCEIPRALKGGRGGTTGRRSLDRIRNPWCKVKFTMNKKGSLNPLHMEIHNVNTIYYI